MRTLPLLLLFALLIAGCSDILEEDLDGLGVVLLTPPDQDSTTSNVVQFRWEEVPHATGYRIQIATPDFISPQVYVVDSVVTGTVVPFALAPGAYTWRVRAENGSSHTDYYQRRLVVLEATSLEDLTPILLSPAANAALSATALTLSWQALGGAQDYRVELRQGDQNGALLQAQLVTTTTCALSALPEGLYTWGVQGQNSTSVSAFSYRSFRIDLTAPNAPLLIAPAANATLPQAPFTFQWQSGTDASATVDSLLVTDQNQVAVRRLAVTGTSHSDSLGTGVYQWTIRTTDAAGNGTSAAARTLTIP